MLGQLTWFSKERNFGFVEVQVPEPQGGIRLDRFFLHRSNIRLLYTEPNAGCFVIFDEGLVGPGKKFPNAINAKIYRSRVEAEAATGAR
jgi:hypothetical protein